MLPAPRYDEPFYWWGPGWAAPPRLDIAELLRDETIDPWSAALLWAALARRRSLAVIAGPSGVGKSTLLAALLTFLPTDTRRLYLRGCFESFAFLTDPTVSPDRTALLVNEISPHHPGYLWGPAVGQLLDSVDRGFAVLVTAHADSVAELVRTLTASALRLAAPRIAAFEFVVHLERTDATASGRRVTGLWRLTATRNGVVVQAFDHLSLNNMSDDTSNDQPTSLPPWLHFSEVADRRRALIALRDGNVPSLPNDHWLQEEGVAPASAP
jgi:energy-coupling factor transporter ATP-binding protein EcfA2